LKQTPGSGGKVLPLSDGKQPGNLTSEHLETGEDREFMDLIDLDEIEKSLLDNSLEKFEDINFDAFALCQVLPGHGIQYMMFKICHMYNFYNTFHFNVQKLVSFTTEVSYNYWLI
jgi:hypothetical protein